MSFRRHLMLTQSSSDIEYIVDPTTPGTPVIGKKADGTVASFETTDEISITAADTLVDTQYLPFNSGNNWKMHINAQFVYSAQTSTYPTLFCCMEDNSPWNGLLVRYEGSTLYLVIGSTHYTMSLSGNCVNMYLSCKDTLLTVINNGTTVVSGKSVDFTLDGITLTLGADRLSDGTIRRYAVCNIYEFYIKDYDISADEI